MTAVIALLLFQGALGAFDVMWNHEYRERLPRRPSAALEQKIHGVRELLYTVVFVGLAWWQWHGYWAWLLGTVVVVEILLTAWDFVEEDKTRRLSGCERVTHLVLSMCGGAYVALLVPHLVAWARGGSHLVTVNYGVTSLMLTMFGAGVFAWGVRDLLSGIGLARGRVPVTAAAARCPPPTPN